MRLLFSAGLSEKDVTLDSIGFNQVAALAADQEQAVSVYTTNEPVQLEAQGYKLNEIRVADVAAAGVQRHDHQRGNHSASNPDLVRRMTSAFLKGLADTVANPDEAYKISKKYVQDLAKQDRSHAKGNPAAHDRAVEDRRLGPSDPKPWENMQETLLKMGLLKQPLDVNKAFTNEFVP